MSHAPGTEGFERPLKVAREIGNGISEALDAGAVKAGKAIGTSIETAAGTLGNTLGHHLGDAIRNVLAPVLGRGLGAIADAISNSATVLSVNIALAGKSTEFAGWMETPGAGRREVVRSDMSQIRKV